MDAPFGAGCSRMPREHRLLIWAAGQAAVELMGVQNSHEGFADDRQNMEYLGCSEDEIKSYAEKAKEIIKERQRKWRAMRDKLDSRQGFDDQQKLEQSEIDRIWDSF